MRSNSTSPFLYLAPLIALAIVLVFFEREPNLQQPNKTLGKALPEFNVAVLSQPAIRFTNQNLHGQVVLLNVWASWCSACHKEHNTLLLIKNQYHLPIYGLDYKDNNYNAEHWLQQNGNPYQLVGIDSNGQVANALQIYGTPETFLLDKQGTIRYIYVGALDIGTWEAVLWPLVQKYQAE